MARLHTTWCIAAISLLPANSFCQGTALPPDSDFPYSSITYLGPEHGLSNGSVSSITQDSLGFMWFITQNGLNRFDGYEFQSWSYESDDPHSLPVGDYYSLAVDKQGHLWMPHLTSGVYSFDPVCEDFTLHTDYPKGNDRAIENMALVTDGNGNVWIGTARGLKKYEPATAHYEYFRHVDNDSSTLTIDNLYGLVLDETSPDPNAINLWIVNYRLGVDGFNTHTGKVIRQFRFPYTDYSWSPNAIMNILGKRKDIIWIGSNDQAIFGFNTRTGQYLRIEMPGHCSSSSHIIGLYSVLEDHNGNLWTINDENKIVFYERNTGQFNYYRNHPGSISFVQSDCVLFEDNNHKLWIGTRRGIITIDTRRNIFHALQFRPGDPYALPGNDVYDIQSLEDGTLLIASDIISHFDKSTGRCTPIEHSKKWAAKSSLRSLYRDSESHIWITGYKDILSYDPQTKTTREYILKDSTGEVLEGFRGVIQDQRGNYWTYGFVGIVQFDPQTLHAKSMTTQIGMDINKMVIAAYRDTRGHFYFSWRHGKGMIEYDPQTHVSKVHGHDPYDPSTISIDMPTVCHEDTYGHIWMGTEGGGLNVFDTSSQQFKAFTVRHGLGHNYIQSLVADTSGRIWVGTPQGISSFMPPKDPFSPDCVITFRNYTVADGLPANFCIFNSAFCCEDGSVYFGTAGGGLVYFHPEQVQSTAFIPPTFITGLYINNKAVQVRDAHAFLPQSIDYTNEIHLNHAQNILSFTFASLNYIRPEKNQYVYMLDGYDEDWIATPASNRRATYTNLDPGNYVFKVKGSNSDGVWNETPAQLNIIITPAFWQTWWFNLAIVFAIFSATYALYRYRLNQVVKMQLMRNRIAHDLHDNIGSTLNSISIYSEVAQKKSEGKIPELDLIGESSRKVIDSMSDIVWTINPENDSFSKIIFRMHSQTHYLMKAKGIEYSFKVDEALNGIVLPMQTRQNFYLIYKEAINNVLKYSNATAVNIALINRDHHVKLHIRDNGIGFDVNQISAGNGMHSMKQRAKAIKAEFLIQSKPGEGTSVMLTMPV